jgi:hypothetical protein
MHVSELPCWAPGEGDVISVTQICGVGLGCNDSETSNGENVDKETWRHANGNVKAMAGAASASSKL